MNRTTYIRDFQKDGHRCVLTGIAEDGKLLSFDSMWNHMPIAQELIEWAEYNEWFVGCLQELDRIYGEGSVKNATSKVDALEPNRKMSALFKSIFGN